MGTVLKAGALRAHGGTTAQRQNFDVVGKARKAANFLRNLIGQLAGGAQHHGLYTEVAWVELGQQGQSKGGRFAAAGLGLGNQVVARQRQRQAGGLNGRHVLITELLQIAQHIGCERQFGERVAAGFLLGHGYFRLAKLPDFPRGFHGPLRV